MLFMASNKTIKVELVYIEPNKQNVLSVEIPEGSDIRSAISYSGLLEQYPQIDLSVNKVGIFSKLQQLDTILQQGDRVEIYRPLQVDPKEARRRRAKKEN